MSNCTLDWLSSSGFSARTTAVNLREEQVAVELVRIKNTHAPIVDAPRNEKNEDRDTAVPKFSLFTHRRANNRRIIV